MEAYTANRDALLEKLGLQMRRQPTDYLLPALALFGTGFLVGASLGLLFAPTSGHEFREDVARRFNRDDQDHGRSRVPDRPPTSSARTSSDQRT